MASPLLACMVAAAAFYHLPPRVLPSIQAVEGGRIGMIHPNSNGTADLGLMQVNTTWIKPIARYAHMPSGTVAVRLIDDGCFNVYVAAVIMRVYLNEVHGNLMAAIGHYHSHTPALSLAYQERVLAAANSLFVRRR